MNCACLDTKCNKIYFKHIPMIYQYLSNRFDDRVSNIWTKKRFHSIGITKQKRVCVNLWRDKINLLDEVCKYNEKA